MRRGITIYLASSRPEGLAKLIQSLGKPEELDCIIIGVDKGADAGIKVSDRVSVLDLPKEIPFSPSRAVNWLMKQIPPASHFWPLNDDAKIDGNWTKEIMSLPQGCLGNPSDKWFPVLTRWHWDNFHYCYPHEYIAWGADQWLIETYKNRTVKLKINVVHEQSSETIFKWGRLSGDYRKYLSTAEPLPAMII